MIQTSLLRDTFKYFAKFPKLEGVLESFNMSKSLYFEEEYAALKEEITSLEENSLLTGIPDYVFGVNEDQVVKRIETIEGYFLFVDYGNITSERNEEYKVKSESFNIGITVARPVKGTYVDQADAIIHADQALDFLRQIREKMLEDSRCSPLLQHLTFPNEITPFFARELFEATGFSMLFSFNGVGLF